MTRRQILLQCEELIREYSTQALNIDAYVAQATCHLDSKQTAFINVVLYGTHRYEALLNTLIHQFYQLHAGTVSRKDRHKCTIVSFLLLFHIREMRLAVFEKCVRAFDRPAVMHTLLLFLTDASHVNGRFRTSWLEIFDRSYVETEMIQPLLETQPKLQSLIATLHAKAFRTSDDMVQPESKKVLTIPKAPKLTLPRLRPSKEHTPETVTASLVSTGPPRKSDITLELLAAQREQKRLENRERVREKYDKAWKSGFRLSKSVEKQSTRKHVQLKEDVRVTDTNCFKAKPLPAYLTQSTHQHDIRLNAATILREDAVFKKKQAKEAALIQDFENGLRDASSFHQWQSEMQYQDRIERVEIVEKRRLEMVKAQQDAKDALIRAQLENQRTALEIKKDNEKLRTQHTQEMQEDMSRARQQMKEVKRVRESAPRVAHEHIRQEKRKGAEELSLFLQKEQERKLQEENQQRTKRDDMIRQIQAIDSVRRENVALFDATETAQLGLLEEMSLVELQERLRLDKKQKAAWEQAKRNEISIAKQRRLGKLESTMSSLSRMRQANAQQSKLERAKKVEEKNRRTMEQSQIRLKAQQNLTAQLEARTSTRNKEMADLKQQARKLQKKKQLAATVDTALCRK